MATFLVTGANRGIGLEFVKELKGRGHTVIGTARTHEETRELMGLPDRALQLDIADTHSVRACASDLGKTPLDVLINSAAVAPEDGALGELDLEAVASRMLVNCVGAMRVTQAMLPRLRAGTGRKIVNITSSLGSIALTGGPMGGGYYAYRMGKAALNMFTRTLAAELKGEGFTCFAMHPGWVRTRMGGEHAPLSVEQSVGGMIPVIEEAGAELNGAFMDYRGREMEW